MWNFTFWIHEVSILQGRKLCWIFLSAPHYWLVIEDQKNMNSRIISPWQYNSIENIQNALFLTYYCHEYLRNVSSPKCKEKNAKKGYLPQNFGTWEQKKNSSISTILGVPPPTWICHRPSWVKNLDTNLYFETKIISLSTLKQILLTRKGTK